MLYSLVLCAPFLRFLNIFWSYWCTKYLLPYVPIQELKWIKSSLQHYSIEAVVDGKSIPFKKQQTACGEFYLKPPISNVSIPYVAMIY